MSEDSKHVMIETTPVENMLMDMLTTAWVIYREMGGDEASGVACIARFAGERDACFADRVVRGPSKYLTPEGIARGSVYLDRMHQLKSINANAELGYREHLMSHDTAAKTVSKDNSDALNELNRVCDSHENVHRKDK